MANANTYAWNHTYVGTGACAHTCKSTHEEEIEKKRKRYRGGSTSARAVLNAQRGEVETKRKGFGRRGEAPRGCFFTGGGAFILLCCTQGRVGMYGYKWRGRACIYIYTAYIYTHRHMHARMFVLCDLKTYHIVRYIIRPKILRVYAYRHTFERSVYT